MEGTLDLSKFSWASWIEKKNKNKQANLYDTCRTYFTILENILKSQNLYVICEKMPVIEQLKNQLH